MVYLFFFSKSFRYPTTQFYVIFKRTVKCCIKWIITSTSYWTGSENALVERTAAAETGLDARARKAGMQPEQNYKISSCLALTVKIKTSTPSPHGSPHHLRDILQDHHKIALDFIGFVYNCTGFMYLNKRLQLDVRRNRRSTDEPTPYTDEPTPYR
jgi:hypothetical protein